MQPPDHRPSPPAWQQPAAPIASPAPSRPAPGNALPGARPGQPHRSGHRPAAPSQTLLTPARVRLGLALSLTLMAGVAVNALFLQRGVAPGLEPARTQAAAAPMVQGAGIVVTGIRPGIAPAPSLGAPIKTAGLPPQSSSAVGDEMKHWQARLRQLEVDARGEPAPAPTHSPETTAAGRGVAVGPSAEPAGAVEPQALEPAIAHRLDNESLAPVSRVTVRAIQRELTARGYDPGPVDGNIGLLTHASIMAYEHDEGLTLTGEPSERLLRRIILGASGEDPLARLGTGGDGGDMAVRLVKGVQTALVVLKYAPGQTDGLLTQDTVRAIREFEMDQGLVPTGRVSGRLIVRLARASGKAFVVPVR